MKKNFKECKTVFQAYSNGDMSQSDFDNWSKENCEGCFFFRKGHCLFGKKK